MRILQTPARVYPYTGGVETVVTALSRALAQLGHEVTIVCADEPPGGPSRFDGVLIRRLWYPTKVANTNITPGLPWYLAQEQFDVIHTHLPTPWSADWSVLLGRARGKGVILTYYNDIIGAGIAGSVARAYNRLCLPLMLRLAQTVVVNSAHVLEHADSPLGPFRPKVRLVPNGVDTSEFRPIYEQRQQGTIGFLAVLDGFHRYKGLDVLLSGVQRLVQRGHRIRLLVGGEGALRQEYEDLARDLGIGDAAQFRGFIPDETMPDFFNTCEVFVLPTTDRRQEGFGVVALEAMACGVPVVVTSAAGIAETVQSEGGGAVVPPGDVDALADAVEHIISRPELANRFGKQGRQAAKDKFSWRAIAQQYERIYEECRPGT